MGFALTYAVAMHTAWGRHVDSAVYRHVSGNPALPVKAAGERALATIDIGTVAAVAIVLVFLALAWGRVVRAAVALAVVACSVGSAELLKHGLPHLHGALPVSRPPTFPSGHTSVAVSLGLAMVLAVPAVLQPSVALLGTAYAAAIAVSVIVLGWHYPSDSAASFFLCGFWASLAAIALGGGRERPTLSVPGLTIAAAATAIALTVAVVLASRHHAAVELLRSRRALIATAAVLGALSFSLFASFTSFADERAR